MTDRSAMRQQLGKLLRLAAKLMWSAEDYGTLTIRIGNLTIIREHPQGYVIHLTMAQIGMANP